MKITLTRTRLRELEEGIEKINNSREVVSGKGQILSNSIKLPAKFNYAINHTLNLVKPVLDSMDAENKIMFADFRKAAKAIQAEFDALPSANRTDKVTQDIYQERIKKLEEDAHKGTFEKWKKFMEESVEVEVHEVKKADLPDVLSGEQMAAIFMLIEG